VTVYVLILPFLTKFHLESGSLQLDFKEALERVFLRNIDKWAEDNLSENLAVKRYNRLKVD
jgi:hypothetical protein